VARAKRPVRVPLVLSRDEVQAILQCLRGTPSLMCALMYGAGLRLLEGCRLRIKAVDFARGELVVRDGKGRKDRVTMLPSPLAEPLRRHLATVGAQHAADLKAGLGTVELPGALRAKYPNAESEWAWQWVFPAARFYTCFPSGPRRRHHLHESVVQRAFKEAVRVARIAKPASCHTLRHYAGSRIMPGGIADQPGMGGSPAG
jgi:integrase